MLDWLLLGGGLVLLIVGGEFLVRGAVAIAERLGMSPLLIGLTLVGFGTATPELVTSVQAAINNKPGIAIGNFVGSSIANVLVILGISALISPIVISSRSLKRDGAIMLASALLFAVVTYFYPLDRAVGALFIVLLVAYTVFAYFNEKKHAVEAELSSAAAGRIDGYGELHHAPVIVAGGHESKEALGSAWLAVGLAIGGLALVVGGAELMLHGAVEIARRFGLTETLIGLTIVAVGTSMPELATSAVAAFRKHNDVAFGNVIGSNIYGVLGIGGFTGLAGPSHVPTEIVGFDSPVMVATCGVCLAFAATALRIGRIEGSVMLAAYALYVFMIWPK